METQKQLSGNNTKGETMIPTQRRRTQATCPRNDEDNGHRGLTAGEVLCGGQPENLHRVSTNQYVATSDGNAVLVAEATCVCGWKDRTVFRGDSDG